MGRSLNKHAPALPARQVDAVDLERHHDVGAGDAGAQVLVERPVLRGAEHDRPVLQRVVHWQHRRPEPAGVGDSADTARCDQGQALLLVKLFDHAVSHHSVSLIGSIAPTMTLAMAGSPRHQTFSPCPGTFGPCRRLAGGARLESKARR